MKIEIKKLKLKDFLCYKKLDLDFTKQSGLTLIHGGVGRGKTAIAEGIIYCLWGKLLRGMPLNKVIREGALKTVCELDFSIDGREYHLKREKYKDTQSFEVNGTVVRTQEQVEKLIDGLPPKEVFQRCMYFGTSLITPFTSLQQYELKARLCQYAKLDWFEGCLEITKDIINKKIVPLSKIKDNELNFIINQNKSLLSNLSEIDITEIDKLTKDIEQNRKLNELENSKLEDINKELTEYNSKLSSENSELKRVSNILDKDKCPTCLQEISKELKNNFLNIYKIKEGEVNTLQNQLEETKKIQSDIKLYIKYLTQQIGQISHKLSQYQAIQTYTNTSKDKNEKEINHLREIQQKLSNLLQRFKKWESIFGWKGIPTNVLKELVLPFINYKLSTYTNVLFPLFKPRLDINIKGDIYFELDKYRDFEALSTGQKRKIDLCLSLAIRDFIEQNQQVQINLIFFDEVFDGLDEESVEILIRVLNTIYEDRKIFAITHRTELQHYFSNILYLIREGELYDKSTIIN